MKLFATKSKPDSTQCDEDVPPLDLHPLESPAYEDAPSWNILPSYQLFQSTFSKNIQPDTEPVSDPPVYTPDRFCSNSGEYFPSIEVISSPSSAAESTSNVSSPPIDPTVGPSLADSSRWENTILANTHKLKKLANLNPTLADNLKINIQTTALPCKTGVKPVILDHQNYEFRQGDPVHGYITITNTSNRPLPFDMFSVVWEGKVTVMSNDSGDSRVPSVFRKFLNMFDYGASWTPAHLDEDAQAIDPIDNARKLFTVDRYFEPGVTYKKFFNFTIPERLLESACEPHDLQRHCELLPTIGLARDQFLKNVRRMRERTANHKRGSSVDAKSPGAKPEVNQIFKRPELKNEKRKQGLSGVMDTRVKDYSFSDTAVSYSVEARVIGKSLDYAPLIGGAHKFSGKNEYIIVQDASCFLRVVPRERIRYIMDENTLNQTSQSIYRNLVGRVEQKIELGRELLNKGSDFKLRGRSTSIAKKKQLYYRKPDNSPQYMSQHSDYEIVYPFMKKSLAAAPKHVGVLGISTPSTEYRVKYLTPHNYKSFRPYTPLEKLGTIVDIPINLMLAFNNEPSSKTLRPPEIKSVVAELVVFTYRSKKYFIPIEVTTSLLFKNTLSEHDDMNGIVISPFKKYLEELTSLTRQLGAQVLSVDSQLIMDMKALANLETKANSLKIDQPKVKASGGLAHWDHPNPAYPTYTKQLSLQLDISKVSSSLEASEALSLIPNFQSCILGRSYYILVSVRLSNGDHANIKVPLSIEH